MENWQTILTNVVVTFFQGALAVWAVSDFSTEAGAIGGAVAGGASVVWNTVIKPLLVKKGWLKRG